MLLGGKVLEPQQRGNVPFSWLWIGSSALVETIILVEIAGFFSVATFLLRRHAIDDDESEQHGRNKDVVDRRSGLGIRFEIFRH